MESLPGYRPPHEDESPKPEIFPEDEDTRVETAAETARKFIAEKPANLKNIERKPVPEIIGLPTEKIFAPFDADQKRAMEEVSNLETDLVSPEFRAVRFKFFPEEKDEHDRLVDDLNGKLAQANETVFGRKEEVRRRLNNPEADFGTLELLTPEERAPLLAALQKVRTEQKKLIELADERQRLADAEFGPPPTTQERQQERESGPEPKPKKNTLRETIASGWKKVKQFFRR